jgi:UDP-N-acetylglucosamine--N-acetylmuramyl-(pentapeptide) pyrophosphoryl-undecaprenol N-acetylglucosamine transferase
VPDALGRLDAASLEVVHQSGQGREQAVRDAYARAGVLRARVIPFSSRLDDELAWADVVVARAGAGTLAEIAAVGRASLLIPYPHAADDHQVKNAAAFADAGAALCVHQSAADSTRIALEVGRVLADGSLRADLATRARALGRPDATARIAEDVLEFARIPSRVDKGRPATAVTAAEVAGVG